MSLRNSTTTLTMFSLILKRAKVNTWRLRGHVGTSRNGLTRSALTSEAGASHGQAKAARAVRARARRRTAASSAAERRFAAVFQ